MASTRSARTLRRELVTDFSDVGLGRDVGLIGHYNNVAADEMLMAHRHPELMEICYLARGRQVYHAAGKDYALRAGDVFVTQPGEQHSTGGRPQEKGELFWFQIRLPRKGPWLHLSARDASPLTRRLRALPSRHFGASERLGQLARDNLLCGSEPTASLKRLKLCTLLVQLLMEVDICARSSVGPYRAEDLNRVLEFISSRAGTEVSVSEMAAHMGLSESWFKARFRRVMGVPPAEYLQRLRIDRASEMLRRGRPVIETAMASGFSSSQYFATVFKRFTGRRPSDVVADAMQWRGRSDSQG